MFHIMIVVNVLYVLAELIFNIVLLKVVSAEVSLNDIQEVETLGRGLAAFGFTFIILKLFQGIGLDIKKKIIIMSFVTVVTYPLFYIGQEKFIDGWAENSSPELEVKWEIFTFLKQGF